MAGGFCWCGQTSTSRGAVPAVMTCVLPMPSWRACWVGRKEHSDAVKGRTPDHPSADPFCRTKFALGHVRTAPACPHHGRKSLQVILCCHDRHELRHTRPGGPHRATRRRGLSINELAAAYQIHSTTGARRRHREYRALSWPKPPNVVAFGRAAADIVLQDWHAHDRR
jgi:hypothetical protein